MERAVLDKYLIYSYSCTKLKNVDVMHGIKKIPLVNRNFLNHVAIVLNGSPAVHLNIFFGL